MHREEALVDLAGVVEHRPAHLLLGPGDRLEVGVHPVAAGEHLVAVADRVEEVDGVAPGYAVPGRGHVDGHAVVGQLSAASRTAFQSSSQNAKWCSAPFGSGHDGEVVRSVRALHPGGDLVAVVAHDLLGEPELEHLGVERRGRLDVLGHDEDVVEPRRRDADQVARPRWRVEQRQHVADLLHAVAELDGVPGGRLEADRVAPPRPELALAVPLHRDADALDALGVEVEVLEIGDLEAHVVQAVRRRLAQHDRVVLVLVPALEEDPVLLVRGLDQAEHLGVVRRAQLEVRDPDLDVLQAEDAVGHGVSLWSGVEAQEPLRDDVLVVEEPAAELVLGPGDLREVGVGAVAAGEDLVADAERVEEVDGVATGDPVPGRALVDLDAVVGQDVGRLADVVPVVEPEREVVQRAVGSVDDRDVVRGVRRAPARRRAGGRWRRAPARSSGSRAPC